jgi:hypothetical protein
MKNLRPIKTMDIRTSIFNKKKLKIKTIDMSKLKLFQIAVLFHPNEKDKDKDGTKTKLIVEPRTILALDTQAAGFQAIRAIEEQYAEKSDQVEVVVRPF